MKRHALSRPTPAPRSGDRRDRFALAYCAGMLAVFVGLAWFSIRGKSATYDEPLHLAGAYLQTQELDFRCNPEDPPLWKFYAVFASGTKLPMDHGNPMWNGMLGRLSPQFHFAPDTLYHTPGIDADTLLRAARRRMILLGAVLAAAIAWWAWQLGGRWAAAVASTLFCLDPNFLAHAAIVKNDVPITLIFLLLMIAVRQAGKRLTILNLALIGLLLGAAVSTKFSGVLGVAMIGAALVCRAILPHPWLVLGRVARGRSARLLVAAGTTVASILIAWGCIWLCYGLRFAPSPEGLFSMDPVLSICRQREVMLQHLFDQPSQGAADQPSEAAQMREWNAQWKPGLFERVMLETARRKLLPQAWVFGFLYTYATALVRPAFLCGRISITGWWYYFPLAMLFKTPLTTLASLALAGGIGVLSLRRFKIDWWNLLSLLAAPAIYFAVALRTHLDIGIRHILPVYPFLFIAVGVMAALALRRWPRNTTIALAGLALCLLIETASAYPDYIPFFNSACGGSRGGLALLGDSNLDWGQELPALADWMKAHPHRQLYLGYFGLADPKYYHLHYVLLPIGESGWSDQTQPSGLFPVIALSAAAIQGQYLTPEEDQAYAPFRNQQPIAVLGGVLYLFDPHGQDTP